MWPLSPPDARSALGIAAEDSYHVHIWRKILGITQEQTQKEITQTG